MNQYTVDGRTDVLTGQLLDPNRPIIRLGPFGGGVPGDQPPPAGTGPGAPQYTLDGRTDVLSGQLLDSSRPIVRLGPFGGGVPGDQPPPAGTAGPSALGGTEPFLPAQLKWLGALVLLWMILTALSEHGDPNARTIGQALAGLILLGALFYLGPGAISNVQNLWTQTGTPNPVLGPNPVPGA